jgi:hypothetical protein
MILTMKKRIMFGVHVIYLMRKLKSPFVMESLILSILAMVIFYFVSIQSVLENMLASGNLRQYFVTAFFNTDLFIQGAIVSAVIITLFFMRNALRFVPYANSLISKS